MNASPDSSGHRIAVIDGLRGYAAIAVVASHVYFMPFFSDWYDRAPSISQYLPTIKTFEMNFGHAVSLFFVLSGFVLSLPYFNGRRAMDSFKDYRQYVVRRAKRLLPLYFAGFIFIAFMLMPDASPRQTLLHMLQVSTLTFQFLNPNIANPYNTVLWSLEVEWWCSLLLPIFLIAGRKWSYNVILQLSFVLSLCASLFYVKEIHEIGYPWFFATNSVLAKMFTFVIGMSCAHTYCTLRSSIRPLLAIVTGIIMVTIGCIIFEVVFIHQVPVIATVIGYALVAIGWGLLVLGLLIHRSHITKLLFENRVITLTGRMCYSIYIWHVIGIAPQMPMLNIYRFVRYIFLLFVISFISYRYIEYGHEKDLRTLLPEKPKPLESKKLFG